MRFDHLRLQLDQLEHRAEETRDPLERRRISAESVAIERAVVAAEEQLQLAVAELAAFRRRIRRLRARS